MVTSHVVAVLDAEGIERAHVWGFSRGGAITATVATAYPERMLSIIVGGASVAPVLPDAIPAAAAERSVQRDKERIAALRASDWSAFWAAQGILDDEWR
jgi:pimeloyl-ACP methyl ester carboxylesterase